MTTCHICGDPHCVYLILPPNDDRYFIGDAEVTKAEYVAAERNAGFFNTLGHPDEPATAAFASSKGHGHVEPRQRKE